MVEDKIAGWLHEVELNPGSERQQAIATAATTYAASAKAPALPDMVLLAHGVPVASAFNQLTEVVTAHDSTFACGIDERETHLAAAVIVAEVMDRNSLAATTAASLVLNAAATGLASAIADLPALAREARHRRGGLLRGRGPIKSTLDPTGVFNTVPPFDQDGTGVYHQEVRLLRESSVAALTATAKSLEALASKLTTRLNASDEELDLLWWCFAGRSQTLEEPWATVTSSGLAAIVAAFEMYNLLQFFAEPQSASALLARALGDHADKNVKLSSAITGAGKAQVTVTVNKTAGHQLLPVLSSLREYEALEGKAAWKGSVGRWNIDPDRTWKALDLAGECLRELIVLQSISS